MIVLKNWLRSYFQHYQGFSQAVWLNILAVFVSTLGFIPGTFFALFLVHDKAISVHFTALLLSFCSAIAILGSYLGGWLGDRYSPIHLSIVSLFFFGIFIILFPAASHFLMILIGASTLFFIYSVFRPLNNIILMAHSSKVDRPRVMGLYRTAVNFGLSFSMIIGGFLADHNFAWYFYFGGFMMLASASTLFYFRNYMALPADWQAKPNTTKKLSKLHIFKNKPFMVLAAIYLGYCLIYYQVRMTFGLYMTQYYGISFSTFGMLYVINMLMVVFLEVPIMNRLKHANQIKVCMVGIVLIAFGLGMLPLHTGLWFAIASVILWTFGEILTSSPFYALVMDYADPRAKGSYLGFFQSLMSAGGILSQVTGGFLYTLAAGKFLWFSCFIASMFLLLGLKKLQQLPKTTAP